MDLTPDVASAFIGGGFALMTAVVGIVPTMLSALRRTRGTVRADGSATRDALTALSTQLTDVKDELRVDTAELRAHVIDVRAWQAAHDSEHFLHSRQTRGDE